MTSDQASDAPKAETIGPYRLEEPLGSGGMGVVWRAWDERLRRAVALKRFHADSARVSNLRERLRREALAVARLSHPAIVHIYDILETDDADWIVMELVRGRTLRDLLDAEGPLDVASAARIGREIAEGLAEAHGNGILHRDLKASNVMVTPSGRVKILDFGLAKDVAGGAGFDLTISAPGMILGTSHAMSPEQAMGQPLDARSDLFSLGSLLYEILAGRPPFLADNPLASLGRVLHFRQRPLHEALPQVPRPLSALVDRLLEKDANLRPQSAREVTDALAALSVASPAPQTGEVQESQSGLFAGFDSEATFDLGPPRIAPRKEQRRLGERRLLTVVCCGLVGLDEVSGETAAIEIEALSEAMAALKDLAREVGERLGGRMGGVLGQLLWLYFGYPQAHEDDAQRAVRVAREIAHRGGELGPAPGSGQRLAVRVSLHSGPAVAIRAGEEEQLQLGATLDLALALQSAAPAGGVVVSAESRKLIEESFVLEPLEPVRLPGSAEPLQVHRVLGTADPRDRESAAVPPLVGREREVELLLDRFRQARSGNGQAVLISGEPGIGKSHLVRAFRERLLESGEDLVWLVGHASPYTQGSPLFPIIGLLERALFLAAEPADRRLGRLEELLRHYHFPLQESVPLFAALLSLPSGPYPPPGFGPDVQRKKTLEAVVALFAEMAERHPMILVIEDLHWVDPSTLELLGLLLDGIPALRLTLLATFRPEFQPPWGHRAQIVQLGLSRLADRETEALIDRVVRGRDLPPDVRRQIVQKTDGVPLFIEELTKTVLESGKSGAELDIPSTLSGSLMARLDRLGTAREVAQVASVIGRTFSFDLLSEVSPLDADTLRGCLGELQEAELVYRRGLGQRERYIFKHALIQDAAYTSLLKKDRQRLHRQIAQALEERLSEPDAAQPEVIAQHYTAGEEIGKAVDFWLEAGRRAGARFAHLEAIDHLRQGLRAPSLPCRRVSSGTRGSTPCRAPSARLSP